MENRVLDQGDAEILYEMFHKSFGDSEGESEGILIGNLARELALEIDDDRIVGYGTFDGRKLVGAIYFTRLYFVESVDVYMLAPVGVTTECQNRGVGTSLINWGISELLRRPVRFLVTYGDPAYYARFGFNQISEQTVKAPHSLSLPHGWLAREVGDCKIPRLSSKPKCVKQFNNSKMW